MNNNFQAEDLIKCLNLVRHPEGGWFRETYRSDGAIPCAALPKTFTDSRSYCTAIYFLLECGDISALHRIKSDELWHFYSGTALTIHVLSPDGGHQELQLGSNVFSGEMFQATVPAGCWFGAEVSGKGSYALVGCTVSPGFDFADFEMGNKEDLLNMYPMHKQLIERLVK